MAKQRGNGEGSIRKRNDGTYEARVTVGISQDGKQVRKSIYGKRKQDVAAKMTALLDSLNKGIITNPTEMTLSQWLDVYMPNYKKRFVKPQTYIGYMGRVNNHIKPALGNYKLKALRPDMVQGFINAMSDDGLSPSTVIACFKTLFESLEQALVDGMIVRNVARNIKLPKLTRREIEVLTVEQQAVFVENAKDTYMGCTFILGLMTGLRIGELIGLMWEDIDFENKQLHVRRTITVVKDLDDENAQWHKAFGTPKTAASVRSVPLQQTAIRLLKDVKRESMKNMLRFGEAYEDNDLVFSTQLGRPLDPRNMQRTFATICRKSDIHGFHIHCLRHTFATRGLENGIDMRVMQKYLGHASIKETVDTYTHVLPDMKANEMRKLENSVAY
jgi:integrase